jgi:hypothetical protein
MNLTTTTLPQTASISVNSLPHSTIVHQYTLIAEQQLKETGVLQTASQAFVIGVTVLLVALTVVYSAIAVKGHVNTANTLEALFKGIDSEYLKEFVIMRPDS